MADDVYVQAYRDGGLKAVSDLLKRQFPAERDRVMVMEGLQDTGRWTITWHEKKHPDGGMYRDFGSVKAYLGDNEE